MHNTELHYVIIALATIHDSNSLNDVLNWKNHFKHIFYLISFNQVCESLSCVMAGMKATLKTISDAQSPGAVRRRDGHGVKQCGADA